MRFANQTVVITGGNSGIGLAAARAFVSEGAKVAVFGRDKATLRSVEDELAVLAFAGDVTSPDSLLDFFDTVAAKLGKVDVLFANAGIGEFQTFEDSETAHFRRLMEINYFGVIETIRQVLPHLANPASVVLTTSIANQMGEPNTSAYAASKAAIKSLVATLSRELLPRGIRVNAISPGPTETPVFARLGMTPEMMAEMRANLSGIIPAGRMGQPQDAASAVLFLASNDSSFIAGQELVIDGGIVGCASLS